MEELSSKTQNERGEWSSDTQLVKQQRWEAAWFLVQFVSYTLLRNVHSIDRWQ